MHGKVITLHPNPLGSLVLHSSLFGISDVVESCVVWYSNIPPINFKASMIPLSEVNYDGDLNDTYVSDKLDGETVIVRVHDGLVDVRLSEKLLYQGICNLPNQLLVAEKVGKIITLCEPLYHSRFISFGNWYQNCHDVFEFYDDKLGDNIHFYFKEWFKFDFKIPWEQYAVSGEGIVIKSSRCVLGSVNFYFGKMETYYLKLPHRASYEDSVTSDFRNGKVVYLGNFGYLNDPDGVYEGPGIYEILVATKRLFRYRSNKKFGDDLWYYETVSSKLNFENLFKTSAPKYEYVRKEGGGVGNSNC
jgi:hypothetical protein